MSVSGAGKPHVVISGAAGFIGSHFCDRLLAEGYRVTALDNLLTGSEQNIAHLRENPRFEFVLQDVTRPFEIAVRADFVLHLASPASPKDYLEFPIETMDVGSLGTKQMLELALRDKAKFLLTSTSESYGDPSVHPQVETYWGNVNPVGPRSCYDESKRFAEALTMAYHRARGARTSIARIFNTFGPRMKLNDGRVVPAFPDHDFRRWIADAELLLCERSGGRALQANALQRNDAGKCGESAGDDDSGICRGDRADDGLHSGDCLPSAAGGRS